MSKIEWTDKTWNVITGCTQVSPACDNCYAKAMTKRLQGMAKKGCKGAQKYSNGWDKVVFHIDMLGQIFDKKKYPSGCRVFVNSMSDTFHEKVYWGKLDKLFKAMKKRSDITFQVLTKRHYKMFKYLTERPKLIAPNIWFGVTLENESMMYRVYKLVKAKEYLKELYNKDVKVFVSCEPLLESLDLSEYIKELDWVIVGGERASKKGRVMELEWLKSLYKQCKESNTPFFFKQWGDCKKIVKDSLKGNDVTLVKVIENTKEFPTYNSTM